MFLQENISTHFNTQLNQIGQTKYDCKVFEWEMHVTSKPSFEEVLSQSYVPINNWQGWSNMNIFIERNFRI